MGRLCLATAIFLAAIFSWTEADRTNTLIASLVFALSALFTMASVAYVEVYRKQTGATFLYLQALFDIFLVTAVIHVTNGSNSPFSALYLSQIHITDPTRLQLISYAV
jgi:hypothetical protein